MDVREMGEHDTPESAPVDQAPKPRRARLGAAVEAVALLAFLLNTLAYLVTVFGGRATPTWVANTQPFPLFLGVCWEFLVGGLLFACWPRLMSGTVLDLLWQAWLARSTTRRLAGSILIWTGVCWVALIIFIPTLSADVPWLLSLCLVFALFIAGVIPLFWVLVVRTRR
jgi:hypothetical protein